MRTEASSVSWAALQDITVQSNAGKREIRPGGGVLAAFATDTMMGQLDRRLIGLVERILPATKFRDYLTGSSMLCGRQSERLAQVGERRICPYPFRRSRNLFLSKGIPGI
jgi:hypothetical protein